MSPAANRLRSHYVYVYIGSTIRTMRLTYPTALVLQALLDGHHHGFDVMEATGLPCGTVCPILRRLDAEGCVGSRWGRDGGARKEQRPPRRYDELTAGGRHLAAEAKNKAVAMAHAGKRLLAGSEG